MKNPVSSRLSRVSTAAGNQTATIAIRLPAIFYTLNLPLMTDLKHERRCELAGEWTDRFMDLKRWSDYANIDMAWPINPDDISCSNGAYKQTPGW